MYSRVRCGLGVQESGRVNSHPLQASPQDCRGSDAPKPVLILEKPSVLEKDQRLASGEAWDGSQEGQNTTGQGNNMTWAWVFELLDKKKQSTSKD